MKEGRERVRLTVAEARTLAERAIAALGYSDDEAAIIADHIVDAALCGYEYAGLPKIVNMADDRRLAKPRRDIRLLFETPISAMYDAGNTVGMLAMYRMTEVAIAKARLNRFAVVGVHNSWFSGRSAYYSEMVTRASFICFHTVSSFPHVVPPGGAAPATGTNPISFGFPTAGNPLVIDMATSAMSGSELMLHGRRGEKLADGIAFDRDGHPTIDPTEAAAFAPMAGHKGFAIALAMQAFGVFAGSGYSADGVCGHLIIVMDPEILLPAGDYRRHMTAMLDGIKATPRQPGVEEIRIPSEHSHRARHRQSREGIEIDLDVFNRLEELARA